MLAGAATAQQAEIMMHAWMLNSTRFCITPEGDFKGNDPDTCYWGLPSISADDPAFLPLGYCECDAAVPESFSSSCLSKLQSPCLRSSFAVVARRTNKCADERSCVHHFQGAVSSGHRGRSSPTGLWAMRRTMMYRSWCRHGRRWQSR